MLSWQRNLYILFAVQLLSTVGFSMIFPFMPLYVADLGIVTAGSIEFWAGMVFSAQAVTMMGASTLCGALADRRGRKLMLERATLGGAVRVALMGFAQNAEQLVVLSALQGAVSGVAAAATALVAAQTPREHSGYALGLINMARWGGVAAGPLIGGFIAETFGYRESFWITGALLGLAGLAVVFFVHEEFTPPDRAHRRSFWAGYRQLLAAPGMAGLYSLTFLRSLGSTLLVPILAFFVLELSQGVTAGAAMTTGLVIGAAALTSSLSAIYLGRLGDRFGHTRILAASAIAAALLYLPQVWVTTTWQLILLQALTGVAIGGLIPSVAALMNLWTDGGGQGAIYGLDNSVQASARVVAPLLAAAIAMLAGYRGVFAAGALVYAVIAVVAVAVARAAAGRAELQGTGD